VNPTSAVVDNNNEVEQYMSTLILGLEVKLMPIEIGNYWDLLNARLASGEIPDLFWCHNPGLLSTYQEQGVLSGITAEQIKENAPELSAATVEYGTQVWRIAMVDGKIYGFPAMDASQTRPFTNTWRKDWLTKVGINKIPETLEEYEEALMKFVTEDPDGNGQNDTYGFTIRGKDATPNLATSVFAAFGVYPGMWNKGANDTIKYGITDPRAKDALQVLNSWFKKGIIDPEFISVDGKLRSEKWSNSQVGLLIDGTYYEVSPGGASHENLMALTPDAELERGPAPKGPNGDYGYMNWSKITNLLAFGKSMTSEEGKAEKVLQLLNKMGSDEDVFYRVNFGEKNIHWKRDDTGAIVPISPYNDSANCGPMGTNFFKNASLRTVKVHDSTRPSNEPEHYKYAIMGTMINGENYFSYLGKFIPSEVNAAYKASADIIYKKNIINFITGARSLDEYDDFLTEWDAAGGGDFTKAANETLKTIDDEMNAAKAMFK